MNAATLDLPAVTAAGRARAKVLGEPHAIEGNPTSVVTYQSNGRVAVIGPEDAVVAAAQRLGEGVPCTFLVPSDSRPDAGSRDRRTVVRGGRAEVEGRLGRFTVNVASADGTVALGEASGASTPFFDLVLDLSPVPLLGQDIPPVGYYHAAPGDEAALERALAALPEMRGEFEKPKYFNYDPAICAHGSSGLKGCTRCIDVCPTLAISSVGDKVNVDPYLCQGAGSCVAACPSGAMSYAFPAVSDMLVHLRDLLGRFRDAGGEDPVLLLHDGWTRKAVWQGFGPVMPENIIPLEVEEVGSVGLDAWLAVLAYGARAVVMAVTTHTPRRMVRELEAQISFGRAVLDGMGLPGGALSMIVTDGKKTEEGDWWSGLPTVALCRPAKFAAPDDKRHVLRLAIDHLHRQAQAGRKVAALPEGAPFGEVRVDKEACTLCMSCVSVCPVAALGAGGDLPQLKFTEWNCVQCGLCEKACPEDAITLNPRLLFDSDARQSPRVLHEEQPFCCVTCGKPFGTRSLLDSMMRKLEGHWMFQSEEARRRLQMCDHCRVKDMFKTGHDGAPPLP